MPRLSALVSALVICVLLAADASAECVNRFTRRTDGPRQIVTLLTGKLTFQEAQALSTAIQERRAEPLGWVDDNGRVLGKQYGELKVIRPMPVACDDKQSGVIMIVTFATIQVPVRRINVRLTADTVVAFEEQQ
ncbi:MAG TPA: hypothetical protein VMS98_20230 [Thermoanaerobaculia bacterium]|nr:hypothetical protein [Thermoanaerobaculia bacterium]